MAIKIEKTFRIEEPLDKVWKFLSDPRRVASCIPGARVTETVDDRTYKGVIKVQVGPSVTDYRGEAHIELLDHEKHEIQMVGKGQDVRGKGSASTRMTGQARALSDGSTEVITVSEVNVVGLLAQLGARMIQEVSNKMFEEFTQNLRVQLEQERGAGSDRSSTPEVAAQSQPIKAVPLVLSVAKESAGRFFRRIFRGPGP
jgi:carbon monoxide dehydrogenase subunit G